MRPPPTTRPLPRAAALVLTVVTACWTSAPPSETTIPVHADDPTREPVEHVEATLRIDAAPGAKRFQGVWLELADGTRWVIDYRAHELWRGFEDQQVAVTGRRYTPLGQAIRATHFEVETLRFARPPSHAAPYRAIGPQRLLRGTFVEHVWPAGTRRAGDTERRFATDDGQIYELANATSEAGPVAVTARVLEPDPSYAATTGTPRLFVIRVHAHDWVPERR